MTDRRPGNLAHLERLISVWSRYDAEVQARRDDFAVSLPRHARPLNLPDWPQLWEALGIPDDARSSSRDARTDVQALISRIANA